MARKEEDRDLVDHLFGAEARAGFGVARGHDLGRQIIWGGALRDLVHPRCGQPGDQRADRMRGRPCLGPMAARHPFWQGKKGRRIQDRLGALIGAELMKHLCRDLILDGDGEKRAKDHIGGGMAHFGFDLAQAGGHACHRRLTCGPHGREGVAQPPTLECGVDDAALALPFRPIGQEYRSAQKRAQPFAHTVGFGEIHRACL